MPGSNGGPRCPLPPMNSACPSSTYWLFEGCMATMMVLIAFTLAMPGDTMERSALKPIAHMGFSEPNMALIFGCVESVRVMAQFLNGYINNVRIGPEGAYARAACAVVGCTIMGQFATALMWDALFVAHAPSFVVLVFGTLAGFEAISVYIAVLDGVLRKSRIGRLWRHLRRFGADGLARLPERRDRDTAVSPDLRRRLHRDADWLNGHPYAG
ncbi:hypothetical protein [Methylorubrum thiocyanatum]|uniref:Uncharacterized protein n=1 Tax=Methylorubrum thiocyanatum TaxID=47958 RepID=A0AA40S7N5_9HYPH|nr:hypothetical protein [Methylorubrum thiocyanatum]MBA8916103.1 hypothetical protein [Methylorubrum thiocyanatum]GJE80671.1 hypothetical protein CJNNKLLH_2009 [Methylorubrum thiocyanatum]